MYILVGVCNGCGWFLIVIFLRDYVLAGISNVCWLRLIMIFAVSLIHPLNMNDTCLFNRETQTTNREPTAVPEAPTTVVNLSGNTLSEAEINLPSKGLSFCPTHARLKRTNFI